MEKRKLVSSTPVKRNVNQIYNYIEGVYNIKYNNLNIFGFFKMIHFIIK